MPTSHQEGQSQARMAHQWGQARVNGARATETKTTAAAHGASAMTTGDPMATTGIGGETNSALGIESGTIGTTTNETDGQTGATSMAAIGTTTVSGGGRGRPGEIGGETSRSGRIGGGRGSGLWIMAETRSGGGWTSVVPGLWFRRVAITRSFAFTCSSYCTCVSRDPSMAISWRTWAESHETLREPTLTGHGTFVS